MSEIIKNALADLDEAKVLEEVKKEVEAGTPPTEILKVCQLGMAEVGERFQNKIYYVSDLMMSGEIFKGINDLLGPSLTADSDGEKGETVIVGTVKGDIHDIGKDLVVGLLKADGYNVIDLGVDVPPETIVAKVKETNAKVLALSGLLTLAFESMKETIQLLEADGIREKVKVMIGGGPVDESTQKYTQADAWGADAMSAVTLCKEWMGA